MTFPRTFTSSFPILGAALLLVPSIVGRAQEPARRPPAPPLVDATNKRMQPEQAETGGSVQVLGEQAKPGMYVFRNRFAPGQTTRPHYHDQDRYITVLKGTWWVGEGDVYRADTMVPVKAGGFMYHPAGYHHYDGSKGEEVIVQITGMGPVKTVQCEVDEQGKPVTPGRQ